MSSNTLVTNLNADLLDGQHGGAYYVQGGNSFGAVGTLGTNDNYALELEVNNARALRIEPGPDIPNLIGGYSGNRVTAGIRGATIGGGGFSGMANSVTDDYGTVSGGLENQAGNNAGSTFDADNATVGGGRTNTASGFYATIGGGGWNTASASYATIAGGGENTASGWTATVPGGSSNTAQGDYSFAAGRRAKANAAGCFTWGDSTDADFTCSTTNQFAVRATGGVNFQTATAAVQVNGNTVWHAGNDGAGSGLDADLLDGQHAGNGSGNVPLSNGTVNSSLNADLLDGQHAGNGSGNVPLSNGTVNTNLNADLLDGRHVGNASLNVPLSNGTVSTNLNADLLDGQHAGNGSGNVPLSNGTINTNLNADLLDGRQATGFWQTGGNAGTDPATNYLGTSDAVALKLGTNGAGAAWITPAGDVGIGTASPTERLTVSGDALVTGDLTVQGNVFGHVLVTTLTGTTTLSASQAGVVLVNNAANCTITLPAASSATGVTFTVKRLSTNQVTVTAASGNIDGNTSENLLSKWAYLTVVSNGTDWFIVARGS